MSTTLTPTLPMTPAATQPAGVVLPCPCCGEPQATIQVNLAAPDEFHCCECEGEFTREDIDNFVRKWSKIVGWLDTMPSQSDLDD